MADFGKVNPEKAQQIINALKDGRINDQEMKDLGLSKAEQEELNKAFSSGEVQIGDSVLINKGQQKNSKGETVQLTVTLRLEHTYTLKSGRKVEVYKDKDGKEVFKYKAADGTELNEEYFKKQEGAEGKRYVVRSDGKLATVADKAKKEDDNAFFKFTDENGDFSWKETGLTVVKTILSPLMLLTSCQDIDNSNNSVVNAKIQNIINDTGLTKEELLELLQPYLDKYNLQLEDLIDSSKKNEENIQTLINAIVAGNQLLNQISLDIKDGNANILQAIYEIKSSVNVLTDLVASLPSDIKDSLQGDLNAILNAIKNGNVTLADIQQNIKNLAGKLEQILDQVQVNGKTQEEIKALLEKIKNGEFTQSQMLLEMIKLLKSIDFTTQDINNKLNTVINLVKQQFQNDKNIEAALNKILAAVKDNGAKQDITNQMLNTLIDMMQKGVSKDDIKAIIEAISKNTSRIEETNKLIQELKTQNVELQKEVLNYIAAVGFEMNRNFTALIEAVKSGKVDVNEIKALLAEMNANIKKNGDEAKALGNELLNYIAAVGFEMNRNFTALIKAVEEGKADIKDIKALLASLTKLVQQGNDDAKTLGDQILNYIAAHGWQMSMKFNEVIELLNGLKSGQGDLKVDIQAFLEKVMNNQNNNTDKIINAIANIKLTGGNVDLSTVEKMLAELIKLVGNNGKQLSDINAKLDVLNVTAKSIEAKLDKNNKDHQVVINILNKLQESQCKGYDDSKLLKILELMSGKLDQILAAIKDHNVNVTVDVTGKVTCECNCGKPHEGILGDLNDLLG